MQLLNFVVSGFKTSGAIVMWLILIVGCISLALAIERIWYLFLKCGTSSASFMSGISKYLKAGDYDKAIKYAASVNTPLAKGVGVVLENRGKGEKAVQKAVDEVFLTETPKVTRFIPMLNTFANIATLLGLTGTIFGLMVTFDAVANVPVAQRASEMANGIALAMSTTLFGLIVAVPTILLQGMLSGKSDRIVEEMDEKTAKLINLVEE